MPSFSSWLWLVVGSLDFGIFTGVGNPPERYGGFGLPALGPGIKRDRGVGIVSCKGPSQGRV